MEIRRNDLFHLYVQITEAEADKIIAYLTTEGFLDHAIDQANGVDHQAVLIGPVYGLSTYALAPAGRTEFYENLGWHGTMLRRLDNLRSVLDGEAAKGMDALLARLAGQRKEWEKTGETKRNEAPKEDFVTLEHIPLPDQILEFRSGDGKSIITSESPLPESFRKALATAKPLDASDKSLRTWAYSPTEWGTFRTKEGTYHFMLFLGGRGQLKTPSGKVGMFSYTFPTTRASDAAVKDGLSMTVILAKRVYSADEPVAFTITLKNVSDKPFMLFDANWTPGYAMQVDQFWEAICTKEYLRAAPTMQHSKPLEPDQSVDVPMTINNSLWLFRWKGPQDGTRKGLSHLPVGKHRLTVTRRIQTNPAQGKYTHEQWAAEITSNPVEFVVAEKVDPATQPSPEKRGGPND